MDMCLPSTLASATGAVQTKRGKNLPRTRTVADRITNDGTDSAARKASGAETIREPA
jgi:hypothetical protein